MRHSNAFDCQVPLCRAALRSDAYHRTIDDSIDQSTTVVPDLTIATRSDRMTTGARWSPAGIRTGSTIDLPPPPRIAAVIGDAP